MGFDVIEAHGDNLPDSKAAYSGFLRRNDYKTISSSTASYGDKKNALVINFYKDNLGYFQFESDYGQKYFISGNIQCKYPEQQADAEKLVNMILKDLKVN